MHEAVALRTYRVSATAAQRNATNRPKIAHSAICSSLLEARDSVFVYMKIPNPMLTGYRGSDPRIAVKAMFYE
jgi:hypothetical protein